MRWEDLPSTNTPLNAENLNKTQPKYILVTTNIELSNIPSNTEVALNTVIYNEGNIFRVSNNSVIVGAGISKVRVCGNIFLEAPSQNGYLWGKIYKNSTMISTTITSVSGSEYYLSTSIPPTIIDVQEGNVFKLIADSTCGGKLRKGRDHVWLLIEAVE